MLMKRFRGMGKGAAAGPQNEKKIKEDYKSSSIFVVLPVI